MLNIVIVTNSYHRDQTLVERSLLASLNQDPPVMNVLFIDQNEPTLQLNLAISQDARLIHLPINASSVSKARNSFVIPEKTDWLIFCDDDGYLHPSYIKRFLNIIEQHPELKILAGSIIRDDNHEFYSPRHKVGGSLKNFRHSKLLMGSNFIVKPSTFEELQRFDDDFGAGAYWGSGEETDFAWKAYFSKIPMDFFPELIVYHIKPYAGDYEHSKQKALSYGIGKGALVGKWLIREHKLLVLFELVEMLCIPMAQMFISLIKVDFKMANIYLKSIEGRCLGFYRYFRRNFLKT